MGFCGCARVSELDLPAFAVYPLPCSIRHLKHAAAQFGILPIDSLCHPCRRDLVVTSADVSDHLARVAIVVRLAEEKARVLAKFLTRVSGCKGMAGPDAEVEVLSWVRLRPFDIASRPTDVVHRRAITTARDSRPGPDGSHMLLGRPPANRAS